MNPLSSQVASTDYLSLLTVQLQNQDPIEPVDQAGLVNDLTQFSILEGIQSLNTSFEQVLQLQEISQGLNFIDKEIQYRDPSTGAVETGIVDEVFTTDNSILVSIGGRTIGIENIQSVS